MTNLLFYLLAAIAVLGALGVVLFKNPLHSALGMLANMVSLAFIYLLHHAEYVWIFQIMVYAGGVMMLVIFVIFLLDIRKEAADPEETGGAKKFIAFGVGLLAFLSLLTPLMAVATGRAGEMKDALFNTDAGLTYFAEQLFGTYLLPFELASILLLVGLVGAVALAKKKL